MANVEDDPGWKYLRLTRDQIAEEQSKPYDAKADCWMPHPEEGYVHAQIRETKGDMCTVCVKGGVEVSAHALQ